MKAVSGKLADSKGRAMDQHRLADKPQAGDPSQPLPKNRYILFFGLALGGCLLDLATKSWAFAQLGMPGERGVFWVVEGVFGFETSLNRGAVFGAFQGYAVLFILLSVVAIGGFTVWLFRFGAAHDVVLTGLLGVIAAGVLGNLHDRLGLHGICLADGQADLAVRDWILVMLGSYHWPNFNIADAMLVCGAFATVAYSFWLERQAARESRTDAA